MGDFRLEVSGYKIRFGKSRNVLLINCYEAADFGASHGKIRIVINKEEAKQCIEKAKEFLEENEKLDSEKISRDAASRVGKKTEKKEVCKDCLYEKTSNTKRCAICIPNSNKSQFKPKDSGGENELPKRENVLKHSHGINSETSVSDSKLPEHKFKKCEHLIENINDCGHFYCRKLDIKMSSLVDVCIHFKPKEKTEQEKNWTKEEWDDLCSICNPQDVMESIEALRRHDKKLIEDFLARINWIMEVIELHTENPDSELMDEISGEYKKWEEKIK